MEINFRSIRMVFFALLLGQLLFGGVAYYLNASGNMGESSIQNSDFAAVVPLLLLFGFLAAYLIDKKRGNEAPVKAGIQEKLSRYRVSVIIRSALLEAPNLLSLIAYLLTGEWIYMLYFALGIGAFLAFRPSATQFQQRYQVSRKEMEGVME